MSAATEGKNRTRLTEASVVCTGKVAFTNYVLAQSVVNRPQTKERPGRSAYHCGHCGLWHIGTDNARVAKHRANDLKQQRKSHE